jgi:hypothetical protein
MSRCCPEPEARWRPPGSGAACPGWSRREAAAGPRARAGLDRRARGVERQRRSDRGTSSTGVSALAHGATRQRGTCRGRGRRASVRPDTEFYVSCSPGLCSARGQRVTALHATARASSLRVDQPSAARHRWFLDAGLLDHASFVPAAAVPLSPLRAFECVPERHFAFDQHASWVAQPRARRLSRRRCQ